ncbi:MAG TPA: STAS domain-containing protein [Acidimicrobiales bacterium]|nr:STAS domain-containing protein [Acidimicrobiales bacterium]
MSANTIQPDIALSGWAPLREPGPRPVPAHAGMHMEMEWGAGQACIRVTGNLDAATAPRLRRCVSELAELGVDDFVLDLSQVGFLDCAGLGALVSAKKRVRAVGGDLRVAGASRGVRRVLGLTGFAVVFGIGTDGDAHGWRP